MGNYGVNEIRRIAEKLKFDPIEVAAEWDDFLTTLLVDPKFHAMSRHIQPTTYWCEWLKSDDLPWSPAITFIVKTFLSIGLGTADVERGFSLLK